MNAQEEFGLMVSNGVIGDIMIALQATYVFEAVGEHSDRVNKSTYLPVFATLQSYSADQFILAVNRLLERQTKRYPLQSVEGVLQFLLENAASLSPREPIFLEQALKRLGVWEDSLAEKGEDATKKVAELLLNVLPHYENHDALRALKTMRDKHIAHPERAVAEPIPVSWNDARALLAIPIEALAVFGSYMGTAYVDDQGRLFTEPDAQIPANATRRLMRALRIFDDDADNTLDAQKGRNIPTQ